MGDEWISITLLRQQVVGRRRTTATIRIIRSATSWFVDLIEPSATT